jgi:hypothetical protein
MGKLFTKVTNMDKSIESVWVFNGQGGKFPGGVFVDKRDAERWIYDHKLTGVLTLYPLNEGIYEWAIKKGYFKPQKEKQMLANFIGAFSSASQEHYHYLDGNLEE